MQIEVGKFYRTRSGHKVRIYAINCGTIDSIHGAIRFINGNSEVWTMATWHENGQYGYFKNHLDIIAPWSEPSLGRVFIAEDSNGKRVLFRELSNIEEYK